jgi:hypothetical protein
MLYVFRSKQFLVSLCVIVAFCSIALLLKRANAEDAPPPAVAMLEADMIKDVQIYNEIAPRLTANREAMRILGYDFDDKTLRAKKREQGF